MEYFKLALSAVSWVFNYLTGRSNANNAPDVKNAQVGAAEAKERDKLNTSIEKRDTKEVQNAISE